MPEGATRRPRHRFTAEQEAWLRREAPEFPYRGLTKRFNRVFLTRLAVWSIKFKCRKLGLRSRYAGYGWGGKPYIHTRFAHERNPGKFVKGGLPHNTRAAGDLRIDPASGEVMVRMEKPVATYHYPGKQASLSHYFRRRCLVVWEAANRPVPEGHVVIRLDDDPTLDEIDNLMCIARSALVRLNATGPLKSLPTDRELRRAAVLEAQIHQRTHDLGRGFKRHRQGRANDP